MSSTVKIGSHILGNNQPVFIIAEIGINHNGDINTAKKLIDAAIFAGCDAVKFQKRTPELCVPAAQRDVMKNTPWGQMTYFEYKKHIEFGEAEYDEIDKYCKEKEILWFASCWDTEAVDFIEKYKPCCYKIASASLTDDMLLRKIVATGRPIIMSTGMSTMKEIKHAVSIIPTDRLVLAHTTSSYPCLHEELNLKMINTLQKQFDCPVGYSGHEVGLQVSYAAVALGACMIERHITLDRTMWGTDQAASVEPQGLFRLVRDIRTIGKSMGDGVKKVYDTEKAVMKKLRMPPAVVLKITENAA